MTLLKNIPSLSISARHIKNGVLKSIIWNVIDPSGISRLTDLIDEILPIPNVEVADLAVVLSSCTEVSNCYNILSWPILFVDWVEAPELISNFLNSMLLYYKLQNKLKT